MCYTQLNPFPLNITPLSELFLSTRPWTTVKDTKAAGAWICWSRGWETLFTYHSAALCVSLFLCTLWVVVYVYITLSESVCISLSSLYTPQSLCGHFPSLCIFPWMWVLQYIYMCSSMLVCLSLSSTLLFWSLYTSAASWPSSKPDLPCPSLWPWINSSCGSFL